MSLLKLWLFQVILQWIKFKEWNVKEGIESPRLLGMGYVGHRLFCDLTRPN